MFKFRHVRASIEAEQRILSIDVNCNLYWLYSFCFVYDYYCFRCLFKLLIFGNLANAILNIYLCIVNTQFWYNVYLATAFDLWTAAAVLWFYIHYCMRMVGMVIICISSINKQNRTEKKIIISSHKSNIQFVISIVNKIFACSIQFNKYIKPHLFCSPFNSIKCCVRFGPTYFFYYTYLFNSFEFIETMVHTFNWMIFFNQMGDYGGVHI